MVKFVGFMTKFVGYDANGVARVYALDNNADVAESWCKENAAEFVKCRPDSGPLDKWTFKKEE